MPVEGDLLRFSNRWYPEAIASAYRVEIGSGLTIRVASAPTFLATRWDAYADRGEGDLLGSHDVEDIIAVVAGRETIVSDIARAPPAVKSWIAAGIRELLTAPDADNAIEGALPDARFDPAIVDRTRACLVSIAELSGQ